MRCYLPARVWLLSASGKAAAGERNGVPTAGAETAASHVPLRPGGGDDGHSLTAPPEDGPAPRLPARRSAGSCSW